MKPGTGIFFIAVGISLCSCSVIEKSSRHEFDSDYYIHKSDQGKPEVVYLDVQDEETKVYRETENGLDPSPIMTISHVATDSINIYPLEFLRKSIDIDLTAILLKYRPSTEGMPAQMITDFNAALYAGRRWDHFRIKGQYDPLGKHSMEVSNFGYDIGFFAGTGTTLIGPFSTKEEVTNEYNGMIVQFGVAGFLETSFASFGLAAGFDYLLSPDRDLWIYNNKPWIGLIVGIALN